jgi:hypothetical protein
MLRLRRYFVPLCRRILLSLPERPSRTLLLHVLSRATHLWGWSAGSERLQCARRAYRSAYPEADDGAFVRQLIAARADGLATSMTYMSRTSAGRATSLIADQLFLCAPADAPCVITYLHYSIDPAIQLALLKRNRDHALRWVVFSAEPEPEVQWEDERALFLAGITTPGAIANLLLPVSDAGWLVSALRHMKRGGSIMMPLDGAFDARRPPIAHITVGDTRLPVSPAIDVLADATGARRIFVWPERGPDKLWTLHQSAFSDTAQLAAAASDWIERHRPYWAGWPYLVWRHSPLAMRTDSTDMHNRRVGGEQMRAS